MNHLIFRKTNAMIRAHHFNLEQGILEPYFMSMELIDVQMELPVSERFHFHLNSHSILEEFVKDKSLLDSLKSVDLQPKAIFNISEQNPNIYVLIVIEKVIQGKIEQFNSRDTKWRNQLGNPKYTQPHLWGFFPLFRTDDNVFLLNEGMIPITTLYPYNVTRNIELYPYIASAKDGIVKKLQGIPGYLLLEIAKFDQEKVESDPKENIYCHSTRRKSFSLRSSETYEVIAEFQKMNYKNLDDAKRISQLHTVSLSKKFALYQVGEFPIYFQRAPFLNYVHELYLFPDSVNLSNVITVANKNLKFKQFNVVLQCLYAKIEKGKDIEVLQSPSKFSKGTMGGGWFGTVNWQNATPTFNDQFKIQLPIVIENNLFVVFLIYHVDIDISRAKKDKDLVFIGSVVYPLSEFVKSKDSLPKTRPVLKSVPTAKDPTPLAYNRDSNVFRCKSQLVSTITPQEDVVAAQFTCIPKFLALTPNQRKDVVFMKSLLNELHTALTDLQYTQTIRLISHFPMVISSMINFMCCFPQYWPKDKISSSLSELDLKLPDLQQKGSLKSRQDLDAEAKKQKNVSIIQSLMTPRRKSHSRDDSLGNIRDQIRDSPKLNTLSPTQLDKPTLGKRISMKIFGSGQLSFGELTRTASSSSLYASRSSPGSPSEEILKKPDKSEPELMNELEAMSIEVVVSILKSSSELSGQNGRANVLLSSFTQFVYDDKHTNAMNLTRMWLKTLDKPDLQPDEIPDDPPLTSRRRPSLFRPGGRQSQGMIYPSKTKSDILAFSWFFFDLIQKGILIHPPHDEGVEIAKVLKELVISYTNKIYSRLERKALASQLNSELASFLSNITYSLRLDLCVELMNVYLETLDSRVESDLESQATMKHLKLKTCISLKLEFLHVFLDHDQTIALNSKSLNFINGIKNVAHPPAKFLLSMFEKVMKFERQAKEHSHSDSEIHTLSVELFEELANTCRYILVKHDVDKRFQSSDDREVICRTYVPIVEYLMNVDWGRVLEYQFFEKFVVFILQCGEEKFLNMWLKDLLEDNLIRFLQLLSSCLDRFSYDITNPNEEFKQNSRSRLEMSLQLVANVFTFVFQLYHESILSQSVRSDRIDIQASSRPGAEANLLEICLYLVSSIVKRDSENDLGFCRKSAEFQKILNELVVLQKGEVYWNWMYGILLQGITLSIDDIDPYYHQLLSKMEAPIEIPEASRVLFEIDMEDNIEFDKNGEIKSGTVDKLVERLFSLVQNKGYAKQFFLTYRSFTNPFDLLEQLKQRHFEQSNSEIQGLRIFNCLKDWLSGYFYDFDSAMIVKLLHFLILVKNSPASNGVKQRLEKNLLFGEKTNVKKVFSVPPPMRILPRRSSITVFDISVWDSMEIARQITLIEYRIFSKIRPKECFNLNWTKKNKEMTSPNIVALTERFNNFSYWLATQIVNEEDLLRRQILVTQIIKVGQICAEKLHNFNAVSTITAALNNSAVFRLKKTFGGLSKEISQIHSDLNDLVSTNGNYKKLRTALQTNPPCIPHLGVLLTDMTFIEEGSPNIVKEMINFGKRRLFADVLIKLSVLQQSPYNFLETKELMIPLQECRGWLDDDPLFKQSLKIEPREK